MLHDTRPERLAWLTLLLIVPISVSVMKKKSFIILTPGFWQTLSMVDLRLELYLSILCPRSSDAYFLTTCGRFHEDFTQVKCSHNTISCSRACAVKHYGFVENGKWTNRVLSLCVCPNQWKWQTTPRILAYSATELIMAVKVLWYRPLSSACCHIVAL